MNKSDSIMYLAGALSKAQAEIRAAQMNAQNPFLKNKYADLGAVIEAVREPFAKNKLAYAQLPYSDGVNVGIETILMHESGEYLSEKIALPMGDERGKSQAQVMGSIITYLRRYSLASIAGVYADEDTDGNAPQLRAPHQAAPKPEPQTEQTTQTWTSDKAEWDKFRTTAKSLGLEGSEIKRILNVQSFLEITLPRADAEKVLRDHVEMIKKDHLDVGFTGKGVAIPSAAIN